MILTKSVQGVQGVQGTKSRFFCTLHMLKATGGAGLRVSVQGVQGNAGAYMRAQRIHATIQQNTSRACIHTLHTLHTLHTPYVTRPVAVQGIFTRARQPYTLCTLKKIIRIMGKKIVCGPDNVRHFNAELRQHAPEFFDLAKQMHQSGFICGLAGASLELAPFADQPSQPAAIAAQTPTCGDCRQFQADSIGDRGLGRCQAGDKRLHWPGIKACKRFEAS